MNDVDAGKLYRVLESSVAHRTYNPDDREDLAGSVVLRSLQKENMNTRYLKAAMKNASIDLNRSCSSCDKNGNVRMRRDWGVDVENCEVPDGTDDLAFVEVGMVLDSIPHPLYRDVAKYAFFGMNNQEIADAMGMTLASVKSMKCRMREFCQQNMTI